MSCPTLLSSGGSPLPASARRRSAPHFDCSSPKRDAIIEKLVAVATPLLEEREPQIVVADRRRVDDSHPDAPPFTSLALLARAGEALLQDVRRV